MFRSGIVSVSVFEQLMSNRRLLNFTFGFMIIVLVSSGCSAGQTEPISVSTRLPATSTSIPPSPTKIPPSLTPIPPTATPLPPTSTPVPPTPTSVQSTPDSTTPMPTPDVILLTIGQETGGWSEFTAGGFNEQPDYTCFVGVDCSTETFPAGMCIDRICQDDEDDEIARLITLNFNLEQDFNQVALRLARAGRETSLVLVDSQRIHLVTFGMLGSNENGVIGAYDLMLGPLSRGEHDIRLFVLDDNRGNGTFAWDALSLFGWVEP